MLRFAEIYIYIAEIYINVLYVYLYDMCSVEHT